MSKDRSAVVLAQAMNHDIMMQQAASSFRERLIHRIITEAPNSKPSVEKEKKKTVYEMLDEETERIRQLDEEWLRGTGQ